MQRCIDSSTCVKPADGVVHLNNRDTPVRLPFCQKHYDEWLERVKDVPAGSRSYYEHAWIPSLHVIEGL